MFLIASKTIYHGIMPGVQYCKRNVIAKNMQRVHIEYSDMHRCATTH